MKKTYQPFIIEKANQILEILQDDVQYSEFAINRLCDILTDKFIQGELSSDDPIDMIFDDEEEMLSFINEAILHMDLSNLIDLELIGCFVDDNNEESYYITENGKKYVETILINKEK
jgi:hypothetical protein